MRVLGTLNEYQSRLFVAEKALQLGRGGISHLSRLTGMSRVTITQGLSELRGGKKLRVAAAGSVRQPGGGRKKVEQTDPELLLRLRNIVEETTAGDPMSPLRWTSKATRTIAEELTRSEHPVSSVTVGRCLEEMGYTLQANVKTREGPQHVNRDAQFRYLNRQVKAFRRVGDPVISVDTKKKELVGAFKNAGRRWLPKGKADEVSVHDFPHLGKGKAIPYGAYDIARNRAVVNVGVTHDTAEFAVESIRRWWHLDGKRYYQEAGRLLICADGGGSNGSRTRAWKLHLQALSDETGMAITVCHYPPGTSKWNKIEHRLFSFISLNWKGKPLVNFETVVNLIGGTRTRAGLKVKAVLDTNQYDTGVEVSKEDIDQLRLKRHKVHPDWNYALLPRT
ncbi:MAG: ISAzo13 family transposase [Acidobacteriia bacterium]|nr:ISAzo13 family transposase [Terriglobia bacterium]